MSSELTHAFDHPEARAAATQSGEMRDRISLRDHIVEAEIGAFQQERGVRQRLCFNVVVEIRPPQGPVADDVDRILSYDRITEAIRGALEVERLNLLETLAERIAEALLAEARALRVFVRVEKLDRGPGALGVEIVRSHEQAGSTQEINAAAPSPLVVFLSQEAVTAPQLPRWLDQLQADPRPVILTVGAPDAPAPRAKVAPAQRRIDLLAIEQAAWVLAGLDSRAVVVGTHTEIDWAMKAGQMVVWAPSKIVLDTADAPVGTSDALALVSWFAAHFKADGLLVIGADAPACNVPVRAVPIAPDLGL